MARLDLRVPDDFEKRFREAVLKAYGYKKGNLTTAAIEAIEMWMNKRKITSK